MDWSYALVLLPIVSAFVIAIYSIKLFSGNHDKETFR